MRKTSLHIKVSTILRSHIAKQIKAKRLAVNMTMKDLARSLGYNKRQMVENWEAERCVPSLYALCLISIVFNCAISDFFPNINELANKAGITISQVTLNVLTFKDESHEKKVEK